MEHEVLWSEPATMRTISRTDQPSAQTIALLENTVWGSRSVRYRILNITKKLARLRDPSYFVLSENEQELCVFVLDFCYKQLKNQQLGAWHFVMAATAPDRQNEGLAGKLIEHARAHCLATVGSPGIGFAYVEASTVFSLHLSDQIGHAIEADVPLTLFFRATPRPDPAVAVLQPADTGNILRGLETLYADHELSDFAETLRPDAYLVLKQNGHLFAGAQVELMRWSVQSIPGMAGTLLLNALPHVSWLHRRLDLRDLRVVRFGNILMPEGTENGLFHVLETALARQGARVGLIMLDGRSPVLHRLRKHGRMGLLSGALKGSAKLRIDVADMDASMLAQLRSRPLLVSAGDVF